MESRTLGVSGIEVSALGFGAAAISGEGGGYGFGTIATDDAIDLLHRAFSLGIRLFDTAPIYGFGLSEQRLGKAFQDRRDDVILVSKSGLTWDNSKRTGVDNSAATTRRMLEQSLRDLQTEYIDVYLIHWPDPDVDIRYPMEVLAEAKETGLIRAIGLSNTYPDDLMRAQEVAPIDVVQGCLNLFERYPAQALFPLLEQEAFGFGFMGYGTLDKGILTGRVTRDPREYDESDVRSRASWWLEADRKPKFDALDAILPMLRDCGHTGLEMALAFVLQHQQVSTALCGSRNPAQLVSLLEAYHNPPSAEILSEIDAMLPAFGFELA
jgi:aryl-alcohol dehydrogenase-like predicted oxidoreductase